MKIKPRGLELRRYWAIYRMLLRNSIIRDMGFKANFWLWIVVEALWFILQLAFIQVIFGQTEAIAGWNKHQMILLVGTNHLIAQLFQTFFYQGLAEVPELIRSGRFDFCLLQPVNSQFAVSLRRFGADSLANVVLGLVFVVYACVQLRLDLGPASLGLYALLLVCGMMIHFSLLSILVTVSFWIVRAQGFVYGYYNLFNISRLPDDAFHGMARLVFTWVLPMLVVANVPARVILYFQWQQGLAMVAASAMLVWIAHRFWQRALNHYTSASS
jgi:ABC-2 type transport system permease protein